MKTTVALMTHDYYSGQGFIIVCFNSTVSNELMIVMVGRAVETPVIRDAIALSITSLYCIGAIVV